MMIDEGYIKFNVDWMEMPPLVEDKTRELNYWRQEMYKRGLLGAYDNGIGYGNISQRWSKNGQFLISGSKTGNLETLSNEHFCVVNEVDIDKNSVKCYGPIVASSESMSHAVIYQQCPEVNAVIHLHNMEIWKRLLMYIPTTDKSATYGTPEMAYAIIQLLNNTDLRQSKLFVMQGHEEGIFVFGSSFEEAISLLMPHLAI